MNKKKINYMSETKGIDLVVLDSNSIIHDFISSFLGVAVTSYYDLKSFNNELHTLNPVGFFLDIDIAPKQEILNMVPNLKILWSNTPIIIMSTLNHIQNIEPSLSSGADDFIQKPLQKIEVVSRYKARKKAKKTYQLESSITKIGDLSLDRETLIIMNPQGMSHKLSSFEYSLLNLLIRNKESIVQRQTIKQQCWPKSDVTDNALNRHLHCLRSALKKLNTNVFIKTVYGEGFMLNIKITP